MGLSSLAIIMGIIDQLYSIDFQLQRYYTQKRELAKQQAQVGIRQGRIFDFISMRESRLIESLGAPNLTPQQRQQIELQIRQLQQQQNFAQRREEFLLKRGMQKEARIDQEIQQLQAKRKSLETQMQQLQQYVNKGIQRAFSDAFGR